MINLFDYSNEQRPLTILAILNKLEMSFNDSMVKVVLVITVYFYNAKENNLELRHIYVLTD